MYSYSHLPNGGWIGAFPDPVSALSSARARYANNEKIFIAEWEPGHYSDFLPSIEILISMMREDVSDSLGDEHADCYDTLRPAEKQDLQARLVTAMSEWEADLSADSEFTGMRISTVVGYEKLDEVRKADFK